MENLMYPIQAIKNAFPEATFDKYNGIVFEDDIILGLKQSVGEIELYYNGFDNLNPNAKDYINCAFFGDYEDAFNNI
jgi:hypothetical protein